MPAMGTTKRFAILDRVLGLARTHGSIDLADAGATLGIPTDELRDLIVEMLLVEFRTPDGERVSVADGYFLGAGDELIVNDDWLDQLANHRLTPDQALQLSLAATVYRRITPKPSTALIRGLEKLEKIRGVDVIIPVEPPPALETVRHAERHGRSLRFRYLKAKNDSASDREVLPYDVYGDAGHWYVRGPEVGAESEPKQWRIDRMTDVAVGTRRFERPAIEPDRAPSDLSELARRVEVCIPADLVRALPEPHRILRRSDEEGGSVRLFIEVTGDAYLDHLLIALGPAGEVIDPPEYRERRRDRARQLLEHLESAPPS